MRPRLHAMIRRAAIALLLLFAALAAPDARAGGEPVPFVPDEAIVRLTEGTNPNAFAAEFGSVVLQSLSQRNIHRLSRPAPLTEEQFVAEMASDPRVLLTDLNFLAEDTNPDPNTQSIFVIASFMLFQNQPWIPLVGGNLAPTIATGHGVVVAVLDSGYEPAHPALAGRTPLGAIDLIDPTGLALDLPDGINSDGDTLIDEMVGHGTIVASIIALVAPDAAILPIRILDSDGLTTSFRLIDGVYAAIDAGADIINISLGTRADTALLADAINEATLAGRLIVAAAGNDATDQSERFPASLAGPLMLSVAATTNADTLAPFSNFNDSVTITAPGVAIVGAVPGGLYGSASGTSFSAPIVTAAAAMLRSITPAMPMESIAQRLRDTARDIDAINPDVAGKIGDGRIDLTAALGITAPPPAGIADRNNDARVDIEDLYRHLESPIDLNGDAIADQHDLRALLAFIRRFERLDTLR